MLIPVLPGAFQVRVTIVDPDGRLVPDAELRSSIGECKRIDGVWEVEVPGSSLGADHSVTLFGAKPAAYLSGHQALVLSEKEPRPSVSVRLQRDMSATIGGQVQDATGTALAGVRVDVVGHEGEAMTTAAAGGFHLLAHAAVGQAVRLHAERTGYRPLDQEDLAGNSEVILRLAR